MNKLMISLLALASCDAQPATSELALALQGDGACTLTTGSPDFGDDRELIQRDLDSHGCVLLGPGTYDISNDEAAGSTHIAGLTLRDGARLLGSGPSTVLRFTGDGHQGDWWGILALGTHIEVAYMSLVFAGSNTEEQTHAIQVNYPALASAPVRDVHLHHLSFDWTRPVGTDASGNSFRMGSCIRANGEAGREARDVRVDHVAFDSCSRSGVDVQRGVYGLVVEDATFTDCGTDVDIEATGGTTSLLGDITIQRTTHYVGPSSQGGSGIQLSAENRLADVVLEDVKMYGRGVFAFNADVKISDSTIRYSMPDDGRAAIWIKKASNVTVSNTTVERLAGAAPGNLIMAEHHSTGTPGVVRVSNSDLIQRVQGEAVYATSARDVIVEGCSIQSYGVNTGMFAVDVNGGISRTRFVHVAGNSIDGTWYASMRASGSYAGLDRVLYLGNVTSGPTYGLTCPAGAGGLGLVASSGNVGPAPVCSALSPAN